MGSTEIPLLGSCYPEPFQQSLQHATPICCITLEPLLCPVSLLVSLTATCTFTCLSYPHHVGLWILVSFFGSLLHAEWYNHTRCCSGYPSKCNTQQTACCKFGSMATLYFSSYKYYSMTTSACISCQQRRIEVFGVTSVPVMHPGRG